MLLTITNTNHRPATDVGFLFHKNPARVQQFQLSYGQVQIFYPEAREDRCTLAMLVEIDPIQLVRGRKGFSLSQYVNDRPYVASSFMSNAISRVLGTALSGKSKDRPELAETELDWEVEISVLPSRGGEDLIKKLFAPLGYTVETTGFPLDEEFPQWGRSPYYQVKLAATATLNRLLSHLYVLIPVLDDEKHYWVGDDEVEKLLHHGDEWLGDHPEQELITRRYLKHQRSLARDALERLSDDGETPVDRQRREVEEEALEKPLRLHDLRLDLVRDILKEEGCQRVVDLGCGEGKLLRRLLADPFFVEMAGMDVSVRSLEIAHKRLRLDELPDRDRGRIKLFQGSLIYRDSRLAGYQGAALVEVIEHLDRPRLAALERVVFQFAQPQLVVVTTPNREYNELFETLPAGQFRHRDHRFEWTRQEFEKWAKKVGGKYGYQVEFRPVGPVDETRGGPGQMGVFGRE